MAESTVNATNDRLNDKGIHVDSRFITTIQARISCFMRVYWILLTGRDSENSLSRSSSSRSRNDNTAICIAVAETVDGEMFTDIGDANPANTNRKSSTTYPHGFDKGEGSMPSDSHQCRALRH